MNVNDLTQKIIGASVEVHREIGPGLLESVYEKLLCYELIKAGLIIKTQVPIPVHYDNKRFTDIGFRADVIVNNQVLIEIKSTEGIAPVHYKQVLTYLRLSNLKIGLLINFNEEILIKGVKRIVNNLWQLNILNKAAYWATTP